MVANLGWLKVKPFVLFEFDPESINEQLAFQLGKVADLSVTDNNSGSLQILNSSNQTWSALHTSY